MVLLLIIELACIFIPLYLVNKRKKRQMQIYSMIVNADSQEIPIQNIMSALQLDFPIISKDINSMSTNSSFPLLKNSHIDIGRQTLVLSKEKLEKQRRKISKINKDQPEKKQTSIECQNCGALNKNPSASECEYCGTPLK